MCFFFFRCLRLVAVREMCPSHVHTSPCALQRLGRCTFPVEELEALLSRRAPVAGRDTIRVSPLPCCHRRLPPGLVAAVAAGAAGGRLQTKPGHGLFSTICWFFHRIVKVISHRNGFSSAVFWHRPHSIMPATRILGRQLLLGCRWHRLHHLPNCQRQSTRGLAWMQKAAVPTSTNLTTSTTTALRPCGAPPSCPVYSMFRSKFAVATCLSTLSLFSGLHICSCSLSV